MTLILRQDLCTCIANSPAETSPGLTSFTAEVHYIEQIVDDLRRQGSCVIPLLTSRLSVNFQTTLLETCDQAAMFSFLTILGSLLAVYLLSFPYKLARNYITARKTGLPIIIVPIDQNHPLWMVTCVPLRPTFKVSPTCRAQDAHHY